MGFIMDGLDAEAYDRQYSDGYLVRRIASYFRPQAAPDVWWSRCHRADLAGRIPAADLSSRAASTSCQQNRATDTAAWR